MAHFKKELGDKLLFEMECIFLHYEEKVYLMAKQKNELFEWIKALIIAVALAALIRVVLFAPIVVDGLSMTPTLNDGDRMIVNKLSYKLGDPKRFDIVVFHAPEQKDYIKRVIGLPGDTIEYKNDVLYVNGKKQKEPYLNEFKKQLTDGLPLTPDFQLKQYTGKQSVPEGEIFVMGDNRRYSKDSRMIGTVPIGKVIGNTNILYWPVADFKLIK
jgi:signal peptidase I